MNKKIQEKLNNSNPPKSWRDTINVEKKWYYNCSECLLKELWAFEVIKDTWGYLYKCKEHNFFMEIRTSLKKICPNFTNTEFKLRKSSGVNAIEIN